jgi:ribosomal protein S18 acetylase RimI-like enzyme
MALHSIQSIYKIRRAREEDIGCLIEVAIECFDTANRGMCHDDDLDEFLALTYTEENFKRELQMPKSDYFLLETDDDTVGYAWLAAGETPDCVEGVDPVQLVRFYIRPQWQGKGSGRALMKHCQKYARSMGYRTIYLSVWEHNAHAQLFYKGYGFQHVGEHVFQIGLEAQVDLWMEAAL